MFVVDYASRRQIFKNHRLLEQIPYMINFIRGPCPQEFDRVFFRKICDIVAIRLIFFEQSKSKLLCETMKFKLAQIWDRKKSVILL